MELYVVMVVINDGTWKPSAMSIRAHLFDPTRYDRYVGYRHRRSAEYEIERLRRTPDAARPVAIVKYTPRFSD